MKTVPVVQPDGTIRPARRLTLTLLGRAAAGEGQGADRRPRPGDRRSGGRHAADHVRARRPFIYMDKDDNKPRFVWAGSISASSGFVPALPGAGNGRRFLGVRVKPLLVE